MRRGPFCFSVRHRRVRHNVEMATAVLIKALGAFFAIMNPFVNLPLFLSLTQEQDAATQRRTAVRTTISSTVMCTVVLLLGATILRFFGIGVDDFRIAGGIVLLIISFGFSRILPHYPLVSFYTVLAMNGYLLLAIADAVWCWARLRRRLIAKFGQEKVKDEGTILFYIMSRCFMLRRWRRPAALVSRGQYPS